MREDGVHDEASDIDAEAGTVIVEGPGGIMISMTPNAADETASRLKKNATKAQDQLDGKRPPFDAGDAGGSLEP